ncbi:MAG: hypothetical protein HZB25_04165 [Candidatus Eisenbacteria bacterium]|nr:hypothetical protein [Candidatus Eisenbacteria bacterium]
MGFTDSYRLFLGWLRRERSRHLAALALHGLVRFLAVAGLGWLLAITLGLLPLPAVPLLGAALAVTLASLVGNLALPLLRAPGLRGFARRVDRAFPELKDRTINALELGGQMAEVSGSESSRGDSPGRESSGSKLPDLNFEPAFVAALVEDARRRTGVLAVSPALAPRGRARWAGTLGAVVAVTAALLIVSPDRFGASARRLLHPSQGRPAFGLRVLPGDVTVRPGEDVPITVLVRGTTAAARLQIRGDYEAWRGSAMEAHPGAPGDSGWARLGATLAGVQRNMSYRVEVDGHRSPVYNIRLQEPLSVLSFRKRLEFPAYSGLPSQEINSATGELDALKGTRATLEIETSGDVAAAFLVRGAVRTALEPVDHHHFRARLPLMESGEYRVRLEEKGGLAVEAGPYALNVVPDEAPRVTIEEPRTSGYFETDLHLPVAARAADDFGLSRAELVVEGPEGRHTRVNLPLAAAARQADLALDWDASPLNLGPGEGVTLWVEVRDNDAVSGPRSARSETRAFRMPTLAEMFKQADEETREHIDDLAEVKQQQQDLKNKLEEATRSLKQADGMSWEKKKELESTVARQKELLDKITKTSEEIHESLDKMEERNTSREELQRKMEELRELMKQMDGEDLRKMLAKMQEALKKANPEDVKRQLENMKMSEQDLVAAIERTIQALKQMQKVAQLNAAAKQAEEIAKKQKAVADQQEKTEQRQQQGNSEEKQQAAQDLKSLSEKQGDLKKQTEELAKTLEGLKKELQEQSRPAANKIDQARKEMQDNARPQMEQAQQQMSQTSQMPPSGQSQKAGAKRKPSRAAQESMQQAAQSLQQAQKQMEQDSNEELAARVRAAAHDLVGISGRQEEVAGGAETPSELARQQQSLVDGTAQVADQLHRAEEQFGPLPPAIGKGIGDALGRMKNSRDAFEKGNSFAGRAQGQEAISSVNRTVLGMLDAAKSMCSGGKSGGGKPKPGPQQQMSGLSQMQQQVNRGTEQMLQMSRGGRQKVQQGDRPGESSQEMASRLAAEQEAVRKGLEDVMREEMQQKRLLGDLSDVADKMKKISEDLANNRTSEETVDMEKKILSRMLDAQRSINRRERDPQRWSRPGGNVARVAPGALPQGLLQRTQRAGADLLRDRKDPVPRAFLPAVEQYFRSLPTPR